MKTELTLKLERDIWNTTHKLGTFGCFEVTIGWYGKERADYVTYDTNGIWRFYEIKTTKSDFHSNAKHSFYGHYNYFVMPKELYDEVKSEIPDYVGVTDGNYSLKKAKKIPLIIESEVLKDYFLRSTQREYAKDIDSRDKSKVEKYKRMYEKELKENIQLRNQLFQLKDAIRKRYGREALRILL